MDICFVAWRDIGHPEAGGSELYVHRTAQELVRRGHRVTITCSQWHGSARHEVIDGIDIVRRGGRLSVYPWGAVHLLGRRGRSHDVVVDVVNGLPFAAVLLRPRSAVALIHHVHHVQWRLLYPGIVGTIGWWIESELVPRLYRRRTVITVSQQSRDDLLRLGHRDVVVIRNGVDSSSVERAPRGDRLCVLARLVPHKQIDWAIDAVADLADELPTLQLDIVGDGYLADDLRRHAVTRGIADRVTFHGHLPDHERDVVLSAAAAVVLPSVKEGWGLALIEGAVIGVPGVALRVAGGVNEAVVDGQTGIIVDSYAELVSACRRLVQETDLNERLGAAAQTRAASLTWSDAASLLERSLVSARRRR
ncbi:MAG: glycosyl transferase, group 1 [Aeromicrobium sp.]|jgi:glycosyltransferase involved in cell wall biosynthesis|nr:glycosyl transferase, group 1 [Aeromicrobium sp.]